MQGTVLAGRYVLNDAIGDGGAGTVYRATDLRTGGTVAVKVLHADTAAASVVMAALRREAQLTAAIASPRVVRVIDVDVDGTIPFLVLEYVAGETVHTLLRRRGRLSLAEALALAREVAQALVAAHDAGIVHHDLKPKNLTIVEGQLKVLDFGLARLADQATSDHTGGYAGTPAYSAPERGWTRGDGRADIYSLGVILFHVLEGRVPFSAPTAKAMLFQHATAPLPPLSPEIPPEMQEIVWRCLAKDPGDRYQRASDLLAAIDHASQTLAASAGRMNEDIELSAAQPADPIGTATATGRAAALAPSEAAPLALGPPRRPSRSITYGIALTGAGCVLAIAAVGLARFRRDSATSPTAIVGTRGPTAAATPRVTAMAGLLIVDGDPARIALTASAPLVVLAFDGAAGQQLRLQVSDLQLDGPTADPYVVHMIISSVDDPTRSQPPLKEASVTAAGGDVALPVLPATGRYAMGFNRGSAAAVSATVRVLSSAPNR